MYDMCFIYLIITQILNITVYDKKFVIHDENQDWVDSTWILKLKLFVLMKYIVRVFWIFAT